MLEAWRKPRFEAITIEERQQETAPALPKTLGAEVRFQFGKPHTRRNDFRYVPPMTNLPAENAAANAPCPR
jgi:hypothetical protein